MHCSKFQKNLSAYLDGELDLQKKEELEKHLIKCSECRKEKEKISEVVEFVKNSTYPDIPVDLWERIQEKLEKAPVYSHFMVFKWVSIPVGAAVFAILLYLLGVTFFFNNPKISPMPIEICLQEHLLFSSEQILPTYISPDLLSTETKETSIDTHLGNSEIDMLLEVYYENN
ncbi:MAG: anti-sigma factor family protein [bacterium]